MREQTVSFRCDRCHMMLNLPVAFTDMPKANLKKIFLMVLQEPWINAEAIRIIDVALPEVAEDLKADWEQASLKFQREYKDPNYEYYTAEDGSTQKYTKKQLISIKAKNKRMMQAVKTAKRNYETFLPRIDLWKELEKKQLL